MCIRDSGLGARLGGGLGSGLGRSRFFLGLGFGGRFPGAPQVINQADIAAQGEKQGRGVRAMSLHLSLIHICLLL